jgi:sodium-coupled neutral amino acid transporter 7/8
VTDLGAVLHMVGGTAASYMIFFLPGLLLINAAIVKRTASTQQLLDDTSDSVSHCPDRAAGF